MSSGRNLGVELGIKSSKLDTRKREKRVSKDDMYVSRSKPYKRDVKVKVSQISLNDYDQESE